MINTNLSGMLFIDKAANLTSTVVVRQIKKNLNLSRIGHLGTLDPFATGLLPIMIGSTTRLATELMNFDKEYLFTIQLGIETDTLDPTGTMIKKSDVPSLSDEQILDVLKKFTGSIAQIPPVYSAIKMKGRPLYEYMRTSGQIPYDIETKTRTVHIYSCTLENYNNLQNTLTIRVSCSKGTYVRSLARDIANALGTVGLCSELRRTKIGHWCVSHALNLACMGVQQTTETAVDLVQNIIPPERLLPAIPKVLLPEVFFNKLNTGNVFFIKKIENSEIFTQIKSLLQTSEKFFIGIENNQNILFLANCSEKNEEMILCQPQKKII